MEIIQPPCGTNHYLQPEEEAAARGGGWVPGPCRGGRPLSAARGGGSGSRRRLSTGSLLRRRSPSRRRSPGSRPSTTRSGVGDCVFRCGGVVTSRLVPAPCPGRIGTTVCAKLHNKTEADQDDTHDIGEECTSCSSRRRPRMWRAMARPWPRRRLCRTPGRTADGRGEAGDGGGAATRSQCRRRVRGCLVPPPTAASRSGMTSSSPEMSHELPPEDVRTAAAFAATMQGHKAASIPTPLAAVGLLVRRG
jgi:hypothetical protein